MPCSMSCGSGGVARSGTEQEAMGGSPTAEAQPSASTHMDNQKKCVFKLCMLLGLTFLTHDLSCAYAILNWCD